MNQNCLTALMGVLCLALMFALMWAGGGSATALTLIGLGAVLMAVVCVLAEFP